VGEGKAFLACALGHATCRAGRRVVFLGSDALLRVIHPSRADNSTERVLRSLLTPDLLILDDPILAQSAFDRLAYNAYQIVIEGDSYRSRQRPGQAALPPPRKRRR
jgi:DNA replication protein DnaC